MSGKINMYEAYVVKINSLRKHDNAPDMEESQEL